MPKKLRTLDEFKNSLPQTFSYSDFSPGFWASLDLGIAKNRCYKYMFLQPKVAAVIDNGFVREIEYTPTIGGSAYWFSGGYKVSYTFKILSEMPIYTPSVPELNHEMNTTELQCAAPHY